MCQFSSPVQCSSPVDGHVDSHFIITLRVNWTELLDWTTGLAYF